MRHYRWTAEQDAFLAAHLKDLVDTGAISYVGSECLCPIVLVKKNDGSWRLCVDPATLNQTTIPMTWERQISFVPALHKIFDKILVNAADNKQRDNEMNMYSTAVRL